ncbi:LAFE_0B02102g1_1 [Lachancea fermentati]|uniref:Peroxisomal membrane protein PEX13 n=1 Tax=Lachancea fermentati TaxID=4955 RepID=A0A1G4M7Q0_LACFM|nr:LAFE_0B02102g1_1 [Lachancea fermentati]
MSSSSSKPRPKPWESHPPLDADTGNSVLVSPNSGHENNENHTTNQEKPELPSKPSVLASDNLGSNTSYARNTYNGMGSMYGGNSLYGNPYGNSLYGGGMGSMYGGYGSMHNGYSSMYGGYGSPYGGMYGMNQQGGPQGLAESTQATFQLIESLIGAVAGFAQMLEATYMATHNSFFTMISVAEQFSYLKEMLGSFFGIFAVLKVMKRLLYKVTNGRIGSPPRKVLKEGSSNKLVQEFEKLHENDGKPRSKKRISWKPLLIFLAAVFGFPFLLNKFISKLAQIQQRKMGGTMQQQVGPLDPRNLEFARAVYDFTPENPQIEVTLKKGDLMAIISKRDPMGNESQWWKVRTKKGDMGYVPSNYIELIKRHKKIESVEEPAAAQEPANAQ